MINWKGSEAANGKVRQKKISNRDQYLKNETFLFQKRKLKVVKNYRSFENKLWKINKIQKQIKENKSKNPSMELSFSH